MIYTFQTRKKLNALLRQDFPNLPWEEDKGNCPPRMRTATPPPDITPIMSYDVLESRAAAYFLRYRTPMPVYIKVQEVYDANYVHPHSKDSLAEAARWIDKCLIYSRPV